MSRLRGLVPACALAVALGASAAFANPVTVQPGDNLWSLARAHDTTVAALMAANDLADQNLRPGQTLNLPVAAADFEPAASPTLTHVVEPGDSLWSLARRFDTTVAGIMAANQLTSDALRPGSSLTLPGPAVMTVAPAPTAAATAPATASVVPAPTPAATVKVAAGDSLYEIARAAGVSVDDLIAWNDLDGTLIKPGQTLALQPTQGSPVAQPLVVHVRPGESLWAIARAHDTTVEALAAANGLATGATLRIGQAVSVPGRYAAVNATSGAAGADVGGAAATEVRVVPGDNLWDIARQHNTTIAALMAANGLPHDRLVVGQRLRVVPGPDLGAAATDVVPAPAPTAGMVWPLVGQITSRFGYRRLRIAGTNMHYGLDIDGNIGDPIRAATDGTVTFAAWRGGFGNLVVVTQDDTDYYYAHASELLVQEGQAVTAGQLVARVGSTGNVTGPHLHFEIRVAGAAVDPLPILETRAAR